MQFGGQHPSGLGVPAVGMAFPGYVAQPQLGLSNSEMTWYCVLFPSSFCPSDFQTLISLSYGCLLWWICSAESGLELHCIKFTLGILFSNFQVTIVKSCVFAIAKFTI